jgi:aryl-alcohol dehydrogenase-like predicted oxidoreductase
MELRPLGRSGVLVSVIGLGTWPMGGEWWGGTDDAESIRTIHRALDLGVSLIDTAEAYAHGHAEEVVGRALAGRRHQAVIADKVAPDHLRPHDLRAAFEGSCRRLGTDYIDVYFVHWPNIDLPLADAIGELERLREAGSIRAIGVSNFTTDELAAAGRFGRIDVLQPPYNLFWRFSEQAEVPYCREHAIGIMTYSSLAQGAADGGAASRDGVSGGRPTADDGVVPPRPLWAVPGRGRAAAADRGAVWQDGGPGRAPLVGGAAWGECGAGGGTHGWGDRGEQGGGRLGAGSGGSGGGRPHRTHRDGWVADLSRYVWQLAALGAAAAAVRA